MTDSPEETVTPPRRPTPRKRGGAKKRKQTVFAVLGLGLAVAAVAFAGWTVNPGSSKAPKYLTQAVSRGTLVVAVSASGNMIVTDEEQVQPNVSGTIDDVNVKLGQRVKAGDVLYTISNDDLESAISRARSSYRNAEQNLERAKISKLQAEQQLDQLESQEGTRAASDDDIDIAERQVTAAKKGVDAAESSLDAAAADLASAKEDADDRTVKAPMAGVITAFDVTANRTAGSSSGSSGSSAGNAAAAMGGSDSSSGSSGSSSSNGSLTISDMGSMVARVQVNEVDLPNVKVGQKASLTFDAIDGLTLTGKVTQVAITGASSSGVVTYDVDIKTDSLDKRIKPNMSVSASITTKVRKDILLAPNAAVKSDSSGSYVQVVAGDGQAQRMDVTVGESNDSQTEITEGISEGAAVVMGSIGGSGNGSGAGSSAAGKSGAPFGGPGMGVMMRGGR